MPRRCLGRVAWGARRAAKTGTLAHWCGDKT